MALQRKLVLTKSCFLSNPQSRLLNPKISSLSLYPTLQFPSSIPKRPSLARPLKVSLDYRESSYGNLQVAYPRPEEIPWRKELCNSVQLIGVVGAAVEIKHLPSGKVVAWTRLAVKKSATDTTWVNLTFWDEMANIAHHHVEKGQQIYVCGRLVSDMVESDDGKQQTYYKVVVQQLNFIERFNSSMSSYDRDFNLASGKKLGRNGASNMGSIQEQWQAFFANPTDWWDNRKNKRNPKYPDFKHKDTGEALWIEGKNNPPWVKSQLEILDARMDSIHVRGQDERKQMSAFTSDDFVAF